ncbi:hypothetical protein [uncultured Sphingomonas sp.]|nr:hypothetical protein [uncultured Sphingomonas sp.]
MTIATTLAPVRHGRRVTVIATDVPRISAADHRAGMESTLRNLASFIE